MSAPREKIQFAPVIWGAVTLLLLLAYIESMCKSPESLVPPFAEYKFDYLEGADAVLLGDSPKKIVYKEIVSFEKGYLCRIGLENKGKARVTLCMWSRTPEFPNDVGTVAVGDLVTTERDSEYGRIVLTRIRD